MNLERALSIAAAAHQGVLDKQGEPYILHPLRVMMGVASLPAKIVAVLHDVVEDTDLTLEDLRREGFAAEVLQALDLVTHRPALSYADYVAGCKQHSLARDVKLADLRDNTRLERLLLRPEKHDADLRRLQKYLLSYRFLTDELPEAEYRRLMAPLERPDDSA